MATWEYLDIRVETSGDRPGSWYWSDSTGAAGPMPRVEPKNKDWKWTAPAIAALLNEYGAVGWEVAGVVSSLSENSYAIVLKRRKEE